jgi:putative spermidine/putrescine transport system ATP-binding protein
MSQGRLEQVGTPAELYRRPANAFVAAFLGESNLLPARITSRDATGAVAELDGIDGRWPVAQRDGVPPQDAALLLVRPEDVAIAGEGEAGIAAELREVVYLGELTAVRARIASGQEVWMRQIRPPAFAVGDKVRIRWDPVNVRLLSRDGQPDNTGGKRP